MICLSCTTAASHDSVAGAGGERMCLAAEGFGNRMCFLQSMANKVRLTHLTLSRCTSHRYMICHSILTISVLQRQAYYILCAFT